MIETLRAYAAAGNSLAGLPRAPKNAISKYCKAYLPFDEGSGTPDDWAGNTQTLTTTWTNYGTQGGPLCHGISVFPETYTFCDGLSSAIFIIVGKNYTAAGNAICRLQNSDGSQFVRANIRDDRRAGGATCSGGVLTSFTETVGAAGDLRVIVLAFGQESFGANGPWYYAHAQTAAGLMLSTQSSDSPSALTVDRLDIDQTDTNTCVAFGAYFAHFENEGLPTDWFTRAKEIAAAIEAGAEVADSFWDQF